MSFQIFNNLISYLKDLINYIKSNAKGNTVITTTNSGSAILSPVQKLKQIIISNNSAYITYYPPITGTTVNAQIHVITPERAAVIADLIIKNSVLLNNAVLYLAACICAESRFDEGCFNRNLVEHKGVVSFDGTDFGICQMAGSFLSSRNGMAGLTQDEMQAKALTAEWSIPMMAEIYSANILHAIKVLPLELTESEYSYLNYPKGTTIKNIMDKLNTTKLSHEEFLAALFYNKGQTGGLEAIKQLNYAMIKHPFSVAKIYSNFVNEFGA